MILARWKSLSPRRRKIIGWAAGLLAFYTIFGFLILPWIVRLIAVKELSAQLNRSVTIEKVKINPYVLSGTIKGLLIKDPGGETLLSWDLVYANFQLASFFGKPWVFKEVTVSNPLATVQINPDYTFNFSDLIRKFASANVTAKPSTPSKPLALRVDALRVSGARVALADLTPHHAFRRVVGPVEVSLTNFRTDPESQNPYSFTGTTETGETFAWSGNFSIDPIRARGELSVTNIAINKLAPLYQDLVRFEIRDGLVSFSGGYLFEQSANSMVIGITKGAATLRNLVVAEPGSQESLVEVPYAGVSGLRADLMSRDGDLGSVVVKGATLNIHRATNDSINLVEAAKPSENATNAPGCILMLLRSVTNAFAMLFQTTNAFTGTIHEVAVSDCAVQLLDEAHTRPVHLRLDAIALAATNISNIPGTNLTSAVSLRWNSNGTIKVVTSASLYPLSAEVGIQMDKVELMGLDPFAEPFLNVFILGSKLGMDGVVKVATDTNQLPAARFTGSAWLDDFASQDGAMNQDLASWSTFRLEGIEANLNPPEVSVATIKLNDAHARLVIETNGQINFLEAMRSRVETAPSAPAQSTGAGTSKSGGIRGAFKQVKEVLSEGTNGPNQSVVRKINIASIQITNAELDFSDLSLPVPVHAIVHQVSGNISDISSENVRHASIHLEGKIGNRGPFELSGQFNPLKQDADSAVKLSLKDVELNPADPYSGKYLGYRLTRGKLSVDMDYTLNERHIKGQNQIMLDQLTLGQKVASTNATKLPVKLGVALLKDRSGKIELNVPIEGSLDDPKFKLGPVIWHTVANVFTKIVTSPFAALGALLGGKGEEVSFQDFAPGKSDILENERSKLDALAKALYERPGLDLEIEGSMDPASDPDGLRRVKLDAKIRHEKWMSLPKSDQAATPEGRIQITPEERNKYILDMASSLPATAKPNPAPAPAQPASVKSTGPLTLPGEKGASGLLARQPKPEELETMVSDSERRILETISVQPNELEILAQQRARAVQKYFIESAHVAEDRITLTQPGEGESGSAGHKAFLRLR